MAWEHCQAFRGAGAPRTQERGIGVEAKVGTLFQRWPGCRDITGPQSVRSGPALRLWQ